MSDLDAWEKGPEAPFVPDGQEYEDIEAHQEGLPAPQILRKRGLRITAATAATAVLGVGAYTEANAITQERKRPSADEIRRANINSRLFFVVDSVLRASRGVYGYCDPPETSAPKKYTRQDILDYNNMLRGQLGLEPLKEDKLLDYVAQNDAQRVADSPKIFYNFDMTSRETQRLRLEAIATQKWVKVEPEIVEARKNQAARAAACLIDSKTGAADIKAARYVGIGSAYSKKSGRRYLVMEYGLQTNPNLTGTG